MIFGHIDHRASSFAGLPAPLKTALDYLARTDFSALPAGRYEIEGDEIYAMLSDLTTREADDLPRPEVHRRYADVQFLVRGRERIGVASDTGRNLIAEDSLAERDLLFYADVENESTLILTPGAFAIFLPTDVHRPGCAVDGRETIRKVVVKVSVERLKESAGA